MKITKSMPIDQNTAEMQHLAKQNNTTKSICGYITCALCEYLSELDDFKWDSLKTINAQTMKPYIQKVMKTIASRRRLQVKKFFKLMNDSQKKSYFTDWVANFECCDYLESISDKLVNPQLYFARQVAYDHPVAMQGMKWEQKERVIEEQRFKGQRYFYSSFRPYLNHHFLEFEFELRQINRKLPVIIATDVLGHYNVTILFEGQIHILDSLSEFMDSRYDCQIVQAITFCYKSSYLIKENIEENKMISS